MPALRAWQASQQGCHREDDFEAMHAALGDREEQQRIRDANPQGVHCSWLLPAANACAYCKLNPYHPEAPHNQDEDWRLYEGHVLETVMIDRQMRAGFPVDLDRLPATVAECVLLLAEERQRIERRMTEAGGDRPN